MAETLTSELSIEGEIYCIETLFAHDICDPLFDEPLMAFKALSDPDTLYHHEAIQQTDQKQFELAMEKEIQTQIDHGNFTVMK